MAAIAIIDTVFIPTQSLLVTDPLGTVFVESQFTTLSFAVPTQLTYANTTQSLLISGGSSTTLAEPASVLLSVAVPTAVATVTPTQAITPVITYAATDGVPIVAGATASNQQYWS
jgi:hypothetical protein